jgi:hypothetical protein
VVGDGTRTLVLASRFGFDAVLYLAAAMVLGTLLVLPLLRAGPDAVG